MVLEEIFLKLGELGLAFYVIYGQYKVIEKNTDAIKQLALAVAGCPLGKAFSKEDVQAVGGNG